MKLSYNINEGWMEKFVEFSEGMEKYQIYHGIFQKICTSASEQVFFHFVVIILIVQSSVQC